MTKRPVMYWRWVYSPIWISLLILYGEYCFEIQIQTGSKILTSSILVCGILTIIFVVLKVRKKVSWKWGWTLCPIWFWILLNLGVFIHLFSVNYLEPRGLPF
jgi:hypothetical protein